MSQLINGVVAAVQEMNTAQSLSRWTTTTLLSQQRSHADEQKIHIQNGNRADFAASLRLSSAIQRELERRV